MAVKISTTTKHDLYTRCRFGGGGNAQWKAFFSIRVEFALFSFQNQEEANLKGIKKKVMKYTTYQVTLLEVLGELLWSCDPNNDRAHVTRTCLEIQ